MTFLLTGATGFIGRNYLLRMLGRGWNVFAPVRDMGKLRRQLAEEEGVDISRLTPLPANPAKWPDISQIDAAVHVAGTLFGRFIEDYLETNVEWTGAVLRAIPQGCPVVVASSQSAGGPTPEDVVSRDETMPDAPLTDYGESKLRMERLIRRTYEGSPIAVLRLPMVLGPRDTVALQIFKMARSLVRIKPGLAPKTFSFISIDDALDAFDAALTHSDKLMHKPCYVASRQSFTDIELFEEAARCMNARGVTVHIPDIFVRGLCLTIDAIPPLRAAMPSLTRDRSKEIFATRWVVNPAFFEETTGWYAQKKLPETLRETLAYYKQQGRI